MIGRILVASESRKWAVIVAAAAGTALVAARVPAPPFYVRHDLVSDGFVPADFVDPNLVNAWGLVFNPTGVWWVANEESGTSTLYDEFGVADPLVVSIPSAGGTGTQGAPTGAVFNPTTEFVVSDGVNSGAAAFIFAGEDGVITAWGPAVPPPPPSDQAFVVIDSTAVEAIYTGLALAATPKGNFLFAADFHNARIDQFDGQFLPVDTTGRFEDPSLPAGYAPFNVAFLREKLYVSYALQDANAEEDVPGEGFGFINVFSLNGKLVRRLVSGGTLNAPWGMVIAPSDFLGFGEQLLVGNFGDGRINVFDPVDGSHQGRLRDATGKAIRIEGLWGLSFGNGGAAGPTNVLFFTAGPEDEQHGLFGRIDAMPGS